MSEGPTYTPTPNNYGKVIIGNKSYILNITLFNEFLIRNEDGTKVISLTEGVELNKNALLSLVINDNIFKVFSEATLILNSVEVFEKSSDIKFSFKGNGRDIVFIEFMSDLGNLEDPSEEIKAELMLSHAFIVTECSDIQYNKRKAKKLTLVESFQYFLDEKMCNYSTGENSKPLTTNKVRNELTGNIIKNLLVDGLKGVSINDTEEQRIDLDKFDKGQNNMFLTFPGDISYSDAIDYILNYHICTEPFEDYGILNYGRYDKRFTLTSLGKIFSEHANLADGHGIETLSFNDTSNQDSESGNIDNYKKYNAVFAESKILKFNVNNPGGTDSSTFATNIAIISIGKPVGTHIIDYKTGNLKNIYIKFKKLYVEPFNTMYNNTYLIPNFDLNNNKVVEKSDIYKTYKSNEPYVSAKAIVNLKQLGSLLFLQNTYNIELEGLTSRQTCKFVDIVNNGTQDTGGSSRWDKLHIGRHFITSVKHVITQDRYVNYIETIKPYRISDDTPISDYL